VRKTSKCLTAVAVLDEIRSEHLLNTRRGGVAARLLTRIREVMGSNLGRDTVVVPPDKCAKKLLLHP
jgi:hypothetical protein